MHSRKLVLGVVAVIALAAVGVAATYGVAWAHGARHHHGHDAQMHEMFLEVLAERLGMDVDQLEADLERASTEAIDRALAEGLVTEEEAQWMKDHMEGCPEYGRGTWRGHHRGHHRGRGHC